MSDPARLATTRSAARALAVLGVASVAAAAGVEVGVAWTDRAGPDRARAAHASALAVLAVGAAAACGAALAAREAHRGSELAAREARDRRAVSLERMSGIVAHELRNPLASLKGHAQLLVEALPEGSRPRAKAERVVADAERLEHLANELLAFVREGPPELAAVPIDRVVERVRAAFPAGAVAVDTHRAPPELVADAGRLALTLRNLVQNGIEAQGGPAPAIELTVAGRDDVVTIEVRDHGPRLPPGAEATIFDSFVTHKPRGTGIGLAVARRAIEQHGGSIVALDCDDGGALFRIVLPLRPPPARERPSLAPA